MAVRGTSAAVAAGNFSNRLFWIVKGATDNEMYEESTPVYQLPFADGVGWVVSQGNWDDPKHSAHGFGQAFCWDLQHLSSENREVRAMRSGTVVHVMRYVSCNTKSNPECYGPGNHVLIRHNDGTVATYNHFAANTVTASCGDVINAGDVLGLVGETGNAFGQHLHIGVMQFWDDTCSVHDPSYSPRGPTIPIYFKDQNHAAWRPRHGDALVP